MELDFDNYLKYSPGYIIEILNNEKISEYIVGNKCVLPNVEKTTTDTFYDIASITKIYTATLIYMAYEEKLIDINSYVYDVDNHFINLKNVKIIDLLSHNQEIWTDGYLGNSESKDDFYKILYSSYVKNNTPTYVDVHYIILSTLLEYVYGVNYKEICNNKIIKKLDLKNTTFDPDINKTASNNYEHGKDYIKPGVIHDKKARRAKELGITTGHASIFTTASDLLKFLKTFLDYSLLKKDTIELMLSHNDINKNNYNYLKKLSTKSDINEIYSDICINDPDFHLPKTYNNMGARYRNKILELNDIPLVTTDNSISFSGYTGPMFTIDFERKIIVVIMCNVLHNTCMQRDERKRKITELMNTIFEKIVI